MCFNSETSVNMAIDILSGGYIRPSNQIIVSKADFSDKLPSTNPSVGSNKNSEKRPKLSTAQYKVAQSVMKNALTWNEDDDIGISTQGLKIVVLEGIFSIEDFDLDPNFSSELEQEIANECSKCGEIKKITLFSRNPKGIAVVKFSTTFSAQECINLTNGRYFGGKRLKSYFWDGVTNYSENSLSHEIEVKDESSRIDDFGNWLDREQEDMPDEFKLIVEN